MQKKYSSIAVLFYAALLLILPATVSAQQIPCPYNINWESGDTTGWTAQFGGPSPIPGGVDQNSSGSMSTITTPVMGFISGRHTITNASMGNDPYGGFPMVAPTGGQYSIKLGDDNFSNGADRIQYIFTVPSNIDNYSINFLYAVVMENAGGSNPHLPYQMPRFTISVKDALTGQSIKNGCYDLNFIASASLPGFIALPEPSQVIYKPWTRHTLNLSGTAGKTILIDIVAGDCSLGGHFGYGYFDVEECAEFRVVVDSCNLDRRGVYMHAPDGYMSYEWYNHDFSQLVDTGQYVGFQPITTTADTYKVILTPYPSVSLCVDTIFTPLLANIHLDRLDTSCIEPSTAITLNPNAYGGVGTLKYSWSEAYPQSSLSCQNCTLPTVTPTATNYYTVKVTDDVCSKSDVSYLHVNLNKVDATDDFVQCRPGYMELKADSTGPNPLKAVACGLSDDTACLNPPKIEMQTKYRDQYAYKWDTTTVMSPFAAQYTSAKMQFLVRREDLKEQGIRFGRLTSIGFKSMKQSTAAFANFKISLACTDKQDMGAGFADNMVPVYTASTFTFQQSDWNDFTFPRPYNWDTSKNLIVEVCFSGPTTVIPAIVEMVNTGAADGLVQYSTAANANVCNSTVNTTLRSYTGRPVMRAGYCKSADGPFQYTWSPGFFLSDSTIQKPLAYINKTIKYSVTTVGGSECQVKDSLTITVPVHHYYVTPEDTSVCKGVTFGMHAIGNFTSVKWYKYDSLNNTLVTPTDLSCKNCSDPLTYRHPVATPMESSTYAAVYTDEYGCLDTLYSFAHIKPLPNVHILNDDMTLKYGGNVQLLVSGAYLYSWSPISTLSNPNVANPYATPTEPTTYYVWGLGENGCRNLDSVHINIDYRDNLFVPSAFSPNGDGKNDVFRVTNLTFQKLQEFRVFNRWGQEIFSTTDAKKGWDGTWKGVPQDMGTYQYIIKVAYPDGYIETYKGDVTLVR